MSAALAAAANSVTQSVMRGDGDAIVSLRTLFCTCALTINWYNMHLHTTMKQQKKLLNIDYAMQCNTEYTAENL